VHDGRVSRSDLELPQPKGLLSSQPAEIIRRTERAWQILADIAQAVDLDASTRSKERTAREMLIGLGTWPDSRGIPDLVADAHAGATTTEPMRDAARRLAAAHRDASDGEVRDSIVASLEQTAAWLHSDDLHHTGLLATPSPLGPLPMGTVVHAATYQIAVTARDLTPAGAEPQPELDEIGLAALIDATGAVAARSGLVAAAVAIGRRATVGTEVFEGGWTTTFADNEEHPAVLAPEEVLLDLAGGRADFAAATRQLRFRNARGLLALAPIVDEIPEVPGGPLLRRTARFARLMSGFR
jgi:hypothetical protein